MRELRMQVGGDYIAMWLNGITPIGYPEKITKLKKQRILNLMAVAKQAVNAHNATQRTAKYSA